MNNSIIRGNNTSDHWDKKHSTDYGDVVTPYKEVYDRLDYGNWEDLTEADQGCAIGIIKENYKIVIINRPKKLYINIRKYKYISHIFIYCFYKNINLFHCCCFPTIRIVGTTFTFLFSYC